MPRLASLPTFLLGLMLLAAAPAQADSLPPWGTGESRAEDLTILLATFGPGDDVPSWFGHASFIVEDRRLQHARLYNYGMFSFDERMLLRYVQGRLEFWVADTSPHATLEFYRHIQRSVRIQELALTPEQRVALARLLAENVLPENRSYLYHHYNDNCATRLRDALDRVLGGRLSAAARSEARMSLREHTRRYTAVSPAMSLLLDFAMNDEIDRPITRWEEAFLPEEMERQVAELQVVGTQGEPRPLVARSWTFFEAPRPPTPAEPPRYALWLLALGGALGGGALGLALWHRRRGSRLARILLGLQSAAAGLVVGLPGLLLFLLWVGTDHTVTYRNENLLLANPLTLMALPLGVRVALGSERAQGQLRRLWLLLAGIGLVGLLLKALPPFNQDNWRLIALLLPTLVGLAGALVVSGARAPRAASAGGRQALELKAS